MFLSRSLGSCGLLFISSSPISTIIRPICRLGLTSYSTNNQYRNSINSNLKKESTEDTYYYINSDIQNHLQKIHPYHCYNSKNNNNFDHNNNDNIVQQQLTISLGNRNNSSSNNIWKQATINQNIFSIRQKSLSSCSYISNNNSSSNGGDIYGNSVSSSNQLNHLMFPFSCAQQYTQVRFLAVPKKKVSHRVQRRKLVRYDIKNLTNIITCKACGKPKLSHRLCEQVELCAKGGLKDHRNKGKSNSASDLGKSTREIVEEEVS